VREAALVAALAAARRTLAAINSIGSSITGIMPANWDAQPAFDPTEGAAAIAPWREALAMLETDAAAPLPTELSGGATSPSATRSDLPGGSTERVAVHPNGRAA